MIECHTPPVVVCSCGGLCSLASTNNQQRSFLRIAWPNAVVGEAMLQRPHTKTPTTESKQLMNLHINYETGEPYDLPRLTTTYEAKSVEVYESFKKAKLKATKEKGAIIIDGFDELQGIPKEAWEYKLGNRSALEWILDQYKKETRRFNYCRKIQHLQVC